jgi:tetratricopeptide (TPR) repeat protein
LSELVLARLERLPDAARQVAQTAAVLEPDFDFTTLRRASGRGEEETLDAFDALVGAGLIREHGDQYTFAHPLVAQILRDGLTGPRRVFLYRRAAQALESTQAGRLTAVAGRLADYFQQANDAPRAAHFAEMAGGHALRLVATAEAVAFYRRALALESTPARHLGLGRALYRAGTLAEGRAALETAQLDFASRGQAREAGQACVALADALLRAGQFEEVLQWARRGLVFLETDSDPEAEAMAHHVLGAAILHLRRPLAEGEAHMLKAAQLAEAHRLPEIAARARFGLGGPGPAR